MNKFEKATPQVQLPPPPSYAEKSFLHTVAAAVVVPSLQATVISFGVGLIVLILSVRFNAYFVDALMNAATAAGVVFLPVLIYLLRHWIALTIEKTFNIDIPGLGMEPEKPVPVHYTVNTFNKEGHMTGQSQYTFTSVNDQQISAFCHKTRKMGLPISRREWEKTGIISGDTYRAFYGELVKQRLVRVGQGGKNVLTEEGEQWADGVIAGDDPHYSPSEEAVETGGNRRKTTHPPTPHPDTQQTGGEMECDICGNLTPIADIRVRREGGENIFVCQTCGKEQGNV